MRLQEGSELRHHGLRRTGGCSLLGLPLVSPMLVVGDTEDGSTLRPSRLHRISTTPGKAHAEHNESALPRTSDVKADVAEGLSRATTGISAFAGVSAQKATSPEASTIRYGLR